MDSNQLEKGLQKLQDLAGQDNPHARRAELFQKSQDGSITAEEQGELLKSLGGGEDNLAAQVTAPINGNETIQKSIDVSDHLREWTGASVEALATLADRVEKSEAADHGFRVALAQSLVGVGEMLKSIDARLGNVEGQPAHAPKSLGAREQGATITKSFAGNAPAGAAEGLSRQEILGTLGEMVEKGITEVGGEDPLNAATKYEGEGRISKSMLSAVGEFRSMNQAA